MSQIPKELKYTKTHEWIRDEGDNEYTIGITDHAQCLLGDLVYIELPAVDTEIGLLEEVGVVESVKAASDIYAPITGEVVAINEELIENPAFVNEDPYHKGWMFRVRAFNDNAIKDCLDDKAYAELVASEAH